MATTNFILSQDNRKGLGNKALENHTQGNFTSQDAIDFFDALKT